MTNVLRPVLFAASAAVAAACASDTPTAPAAARNTTAQAVAPATRNPVVGYYNVTI